jgi:c-di-GMP-binding flagellar brake protein YcgR
MLTEELIPTVDGDRRVHPRIEFVRPCKVYSPTLQRYFLGATRDLSAGGMLIHVPHVVDVRPGDVLHVGVATKRREQFLRSSDMLEATVVRSMTTVDDHTTFAVKFAEDQAKVEIPPLRLAA